MRSANPVLNDNTFTHHIDLTGQDRMTLMGTVQKTATMLVILLITASITWKMVYGGNASAGMLTIGGAIGGLSLIHI